MTSITEALQDMERAMAAMEQARADKTVPGALLGALTWDFEQAERAYYRLRDAARQERTEQDGPILRFPGFPPIRGVGPVITAEEAAGQ